MHVLKLLGKSLVFILSLILAVVLTMMLFLVMSKLQEALLLPGDYLYWILKAPYSYLFLFWEIEIIALFSFVLSRNFRSAATYVAARLSQLFRNWRPHAKGALAVLNALVLYLMLVNISVLTAEGITDHSTFKPQGVFIPYESIVSIDAGVSGVKRENLSFQGEFYYKVTLSDGRVLNLADMGGSSTEEDFRFVLDRLDEKLRTYGIPKKTSLENLPHLTESLDPIYVDAIGKILRRP